MPTLEELENVVWPESGIDSHLVVTCHQLRKKQIEHFTTEDFRIMIGQNIGLHFLVPRAMEVLEQNPLADGDFYSGDLLKNLISVESSFFDRSPDILARVVSVTKRAIAMLQSESSDADLVSAFRHFIHRNET